MGSDAPMIEFRERAQSRNSPLPGRKSWLTHERRVFLLALASGGAGTTCSILLLWTAALDPALRFTLMFTLVITWLLFALGVKSAVARPLQTLANVQAALREGDFSIRVRGAGTEDALGELILEVNALCDALHEQRLSAVEANALLNTVMAEIDVAVFSFDANQQLRLLNRAGERLLALDAGRALGRTADELGLGDCLTGETALTIERAFAGRSGRWGVRRSMFRLGGAPHQLLVLADLSRALREEEREAWQRLVRVLGHELNNSLTPIRSIAESLEATMKHATRAPDWDDDVRRGLRIIVDRADSLSRFMKDYSRLARLPNPQISKVDVASAIRAAAALEKRLPVTVVPGASIALQADPDQLQQVLINLIRNAVDASLETQSAVSVRWVRQRNAVEIVIEDEGPGIANSANLFVPFFTTKPHGSGIGLVLSRQIVEAHGGSMTLANRSDRNGCRATIRLPLTNLADAQPRAASSR